MNKMLTHTDLCRLTAEKFCKAVAIYEVKAQAENPDVITWYTSGHSIVFEIKMSRSDFLADAKKLCRNVDTSLKALLEQKLSERGYTTCTIYEIYNTGKKENRINDQKDIIRDKIIFPRKGMYGENTQMGKALRQMTTYSFAYPNKHDDMIDSVAMFAKEIILGNAEPQRATAVRRLNF